MALQVTPNWLTVLRIALIPAGVWAIFHSPSNTWQSIAWLIFFVLGMTDILDGHWARKSGRTTPLGAFLDPVADKALIGAAMISLAILDRFPWWIAFVILFREIGITIFRLAVIRDGVIPASKGGRTEPREIASMGSSGCESNQRPSQPLLMCFSGDAVCHFAIEEKCE